MKYSIEGTYNIPEWWDVTLDAESKEEAEDQAFKSIEMSYPEAIDVEVISVREID